MKILITGGTGSFGSTMVRRLLDATDIDVDRIRVFSRDEAKQHDMRMSINSDLLEFVIGDIRDYDSVVNAIKDVDVIFHASALKQVPTGEFFPDQMIKTNVLGSQNLIRAVENCDDIKRVVLLSTDKAVYPINTMGMTKALAEKMFIAASRSGKSIYNIVRYGNVMASRGSVIPLFIDKIIKGEELPITDPDMTRFLLSLDDAIDLVLHAIKEGEQGDLFVKKAPAATVETIAEALSDIFKVENKQKVIGIRAGEKKHESLLTENELSRSEENEFYYRVFPETDGLRYDKYYKEGAEQIYQGDYTSENTVRLNKEDTVALLNDLAYIQGYKK